MTRPIIAKTTTLDGIRHQLATVTAYEERDHDGSAFYTVNEEIAEIGNEENGYFFAYEYDTMRQALEAVAAASGNVMPTNGGVPAFDEA